MSEPLRARLDYKAPRPTFIDDAEGDYLVTYSPLDAPLAEPDVALAREHIVAIFDQSADRPSIRALARHALAALASPDKGEPR